MPWGIDRTYRLGPIVRYLAPRALLAAAGLPFFAAGALFHYLPYKIPAVLARFFATEPVERATIKLLGGLVAFPLFYALAVLLSGRFLLLALLPPLGIFSLLYAEAVSELVREVRIFFWHRRPGDHRRRLKLWREDLAAELETRRQEYEA